MTLSRPCPPDTVATAHAARRRDVFRKQAGTA
jgi:hypothetical protein